MVRQSFLQAAIDIQPNEKQLEFEFDITTDGDYYIMYKTGTDSGPLGTHTLNTISIQKDTTEVSINYKYTDSASLTDGFTVTNLRFKGDPTFEIMNFGEAPFTRAGYQLFKYSGKYGDENRHPFDKPKILSYTNLTYLFRYNHPELLRARVS